MSVLVIAEAGVNHNGDLAIAKRLIDVARDAGADMVKFQTFAADRLVTRDAPKAKYQHATTASDQSHYQMIHQLELTHAMHIDLMAYCRSRQIEFFSTAFDIESVDLLAGLGFGRFKVPSGELTNLPYLRHVGALRKSVLLSTGMSTLDEVSKAVEILEESGTPRSAITVLHCNTEYPTPIDDVNLRAMLTIRDTLRVPVGYSDHTEGIEASIAAVALGAVVIEKHFTLDRTMPGPDHRASLEPEGLAALVRAIRQVERAMGDGVKRVTASESKNVAIARKSLVAARAIRAGETFSAANVTVKRPGTGLSPMMWDRVIGLTARRDFAPDELLEL